jgi:hypothetical protein
MRKPILILCAVLGGLMLWHLLRMPPESPVSGGVSQSVPPASAPAEPVRPGDAGSEPSNVPKTQVKAKHTAPAESASAASRDQWPTPDLTRPLPPMPTIQIGGRDWKVLGTNDIVNDHGKQSILVLRDEESGQLAYRQSALRFVLKDGVDYESFIVERTLARRLFANPLHGDIAVDAADIGAEYAVLSGDPRVIKVVFIPLVVPFRPK